MHQIMLLRVLIMLMLLPSLVYADGTCEQWAAKITSIQGVVEIRKNSTNMWVLAKLNDDICTGNSLRTASNSRATLQIQNETFMVLKEHSTVRFSSAQQSKKGVFSDIMSLFSGEAFFRSRRSRELSIETPFVNAMHEGTEFLVKVTKDNTQVIVFNGIVLANNSEGQVRISEGQSAIAFEGRAPVIGPGIELRDAVQWTLYYPPVIDYQSIRQNKSNQLLKPVLDTFRLNDLTGALERLNSIKEAGRNADYHILYASLLLIVGQVQQAQIHLDQVQQDSVQNANVLALRSMIALAKNEQQQALKLAQQAQKINPQMAAPKIALSYVYQSLFDVEKALKSATQAVDALPDNGLAWARVAELQLATGNVDASMVAAKKAQILNPQLAKTNTVLGFAQLASLNLNEAEQSFHIAIQRAPSDPLARLGLGLAKIRQGHIKSGTKEMEVAANLDPDNALIRSYLGKAYYEQRRGDIASTEYAIAKDLDPNDPTPWFYDAIHKQTVNRPIEALHDMQKAIELNDNRAVFRSRLLLDQDLAARSASLGRIYHDLGFEQLGRLSGWKAVTSDHGDYSAHRLLSDNYTALPRHEIARVSELLQSQLLQPINLTPVQPKLAESNILLLDGQGPSAASFNEFNPLFARNRLALQTSGVYGNNDSWGEEVTQSGVWNNVSYSLGQFHYQTDGYRDNNDFDTDIYSAFVQGAITPTLNIQAEYRNRQTDSGDLRLNFDPADFSTFNRSRVRHNSYRFGGRYEPFQHSKFLFSFIYGDRKSKLTQSNSEILSDEDGLTGEAQYIGRTDWVNYQVGGGAYHTNFKRDIRSARPSKDQFEIDQHNVYGYANIKLPYDMTWTLGLSYDSYQQADYKLDEINPKIGVQWNLSKYLRLRAAGFKTVKRTFLANQTIEPTQIAGFNQFYDDANGSQAWRYGGAIDATFSKNLYTGVEFTRRDIDSPFNVGLPFFQMEKQQDDAFRAYLYWTPHEHLAFNADYQRNRFIFKSQSPLPTRRPQRILTQTVPLTIRYFSPHGLFASFTSKYINQSVTLASTSTFQKDNGDFWVFDIGLGYRLLRRYGVISIKVVNLLDQKFLFQDDSFRTGSNTFSSLLTPERSIFGNITVNF
jgi:tetratricopeptide (TPR) repeat protein